MSSIPAIQAADIPAPLSDHAIYLAHKFAIITIVLIVITTAIFVARIWTRACCAVRMSIDDYVAIAAYAFVMGSSILLLHTISWFFAGDDPSKLTLLDMETSYKFATIAEPVWTWAMVLTKVSIALMLLRFEQNRYMRRFAYIMIGLQVTQGIACTLFQLLQCIPLHALWDFLHRSEVRCLSRNAWKASLIFFQALNFITDWTFALMPISFLRKVQRPLSERVSVGFLMGLGVFVGIVSVFKINCLSRLSESDDNAVDSFRIGMLSAAEALLAFAAACVPGLRAPFQRALEHCGLATAKPSFSDSPYNYGASTARLQTTISTAGFALKALDGGDDIRSDTQALTRTGEEAHDTLSDVWRTTEVEVQREVEKLDRIRKSFTPAPPRKDSWDEVEKIQSHTPALPRIESWMEVEKIQRSHTPALPSDESWDELEDIQRSHTPALPPLAKHRRRETWDEEAGEASRKRRIW